MLDQLPEVMMKSNDSLIICKSCKIKILFYGTFHMGKTIVTVTMTKEDHVKNMI